MMRFAGSALGTPGTKRPWGALPGRLASTCILALACAAVLANGPATAQEALAPHKVQAVVIPAPDASSAASASSAPILAEPNEDRFARDVAVPRQTEAAASSKPEAPKSQGGKTEAASSMLSMFPLAKEPAKAPAGPEAGRTMRMPVSATLRARPAGDGRPLRTIAAGTAVTVSDCNRGWCAVRAENQSGFMAERLLDNKPAPKLAATKPGNPKPTKAVQRTASPKKAEKAVEAAQPKPVAAPAAKPAPQIFVPSAR